MADEAKPMEAAATEGGADGAESSLYTKKKKAAFRRRVKKADDSGATSTGTKTAAHLRAERDLQELELPDNVKLVQKDPDDVMNFSLVVRPDPGSYWHKGTYEFQFKIAARYPYDPPKVTCVDKIYHPNIDTEGGVCVNVLRPWKPTYSVQIILFGLLFLFTDPNPDDPLNKSAADDMRSDTSRFARNVKSAMMGKSVGSEPFPKNRGLP